MCVCVCVCLSRAIEALSRHTSMHARTRHTHQYMPYNCCNTQYAVATAAILNTLLHTTAAILNTLYMLQWVQLVVTRAQKRMCVCVCVCVFACVCNTRTGTCHTTAAAAPVAGACPGSRTSPTHGSPHTWAAAAQQSPHKRDARLACGDAAGHRRKGPQQQAPARRPKSTRT